MEELVEVPPIGLVYIEEGQPLLDIDDGLFGTRWGSCPEEIGCLHIARHPENVKFPEAVVGFATISP